MRRFYSFQEDDVKDHISQVKTFDDVCQLLNDIVESETNLARMTFSPKQVFAIDYFGKDKTLRHIFMTRKAYEIFGEPTKEEADSFSILEESR